MRKRGREVVGKRVTSNPLEANKSRLRRKLKTQEDRYCGRRRGTQFLETLERVLRCSVEV